MIICTQNRLTESCSVGWCLQVTKRGRELIQDEYDGTGSSRSGSPKACGPRRTKNLNDREIKHKWWAMLRVLGSIRDEKLHHDDRCAPSLSRKRYGVGKVRSSTRRRPLSHSLPLPIPHSHPQFLQKKTTTSPLSFFFNLRLFHNSFSSSCLKPDPVALSRCHLLSALLIE